jgi:hypothetical protein
MTHLFFYYTSFYDEAIDKLKSQSVLWSTMAELYVKFEKVVPEKITEYVIVKYAVDQYHDFSMDEGFQKMKTMIHQSQLKQYIKERLQEKWRDQTLKSFKRIKNFINSKAWEITVTACEIGQIAIVLVLAEYCLPRASKGYDSIVEFNRISDVAKASEAEANLR